MRQREVKVLKNVLWKAQYFKLYDKWKLRCITVLWRTSFCPPKICILYSKIFTRMNWGKKPPHLSEDVRIRSSQHCWDVY